MTPCKETLIAEDFSRLWNEADKMRGPDLADICKTLATVHDVEPEEVDRIQREHATEGPC